MAFSLLDWWRSWRTRPLDHLRFILYTRQGCHLCDEAAETLARAQRRYLFNLETVDVDADPELRQRYGLEVPVVTVNGRLRFRGRVNAVLLERLLHAANASK
jgi:glutaredoxin